jgi:hypothetical protein
MAMTASSLHIPSRRANRPAGLKALNLLTMPAAKDAHDVHPSGHEASSMQHDVR